MFKKNNNKNSVTAKLHHAHDLSFKEDLSNKAIAKKYLETHLPTEIAAKIDLSTLTIIKNNFITKHFKTFAADIVYRADFLHTKNSCYFLLESQASPDRFMAFRMLKYALLIIADHFKQHPKCKHLPPVYPLLLNNGTQSPYKYPMKFLDLFSADGKFIMQSLLQKNIQVIEPKQLQLEEILQHGCISLLEFIRKHIHAKDFAEHLPDLKKVIKNFLRLKFAGKEDCLNNNLKYIMHKANIKNSEKFFNEIQEILEEDDSMPTLAQYFRKEGRQEGVHNVISIMVNRGSTIPQVAKLTGISADKIKSLLAKK